MKNFSLKDENGKIYYGWWIVLAAALICGLVYSGIVSVTGVFMLPVTTELELPIGSYSFYLTVMSLTNKMCIRDRAKSDLFRHARHPVKTRLLPKSRITCKALRPCIL